MQNKNIMSLRAAVLCGEAISAAIWEIALGKSTPRNNVKELANDYKAVGLIPS